VAGLLVLSMSATPALAHDEGYGGGGYFGIFRQHLNDELEHLNFHRQFNYAHEEAHARGFDSSAEHRAWHRAYGATHQDFHQDHPGVGYWGWSRYR